MKVTVRFATLEGKFGFSKTEVFSDMVSAKSAVEVYATTGGFSRVKMVGDEDGETRFTATTPAGRVGRNVAFLDIDGGNDW